MLGGHSGVHAAGGVSGGASADGLGDILSEDAVILGNHSGVQAGGGLNSGVAAGGQGGISANEGSSVNTDSHSGYSPIDGHSSATTGAIIDTTGPAAGAGHVIDTTGSVAGGADAGSHAGGVIITPQPATQSSTQSGGEASHSSATIDEHSTLSSNTHVVSEPEHSQPEPPAQAPTYDAGHDQAAHAAIDTHSSTHTDMGGHGF